MQNTHLDKWAIHLVQHRFDHTVETRPLPPMSERHDILFPEYVILLLVYEGRNIVEPVPHASVITFGWSLERDELSCFDE